MKKCWILCLFLWAVNLSSVQAGPFEAKYNQPQWLPVVVLDSANESPNLGVVASAITFKYKKGMTGAWTVQALNDDCATPSAGDWCEEEGGIYGIGHLQPDNLAGRQAQSPELVCKMLNFCVGLRKAQPNTRAAIPVVPARVAAKCELIRPLMRPMRQ